MGIAVAASVAVADAVFSLPTNSYYSAADKSLRNDLVSLCSEHNLHS